MKDKLIEKLKEIIKILKEQSAYNGKYSLHELESEIVIIEAGFCTCGNPSKEGNCHFEGDEKLIYECVDCGKMNVL